MTQVEICAGLASSKHCGVRSAGFSLVELMVAMVIGLLGIIVMMQMFSVFEEQKRTTTGGDDAISSGGIALNGIQRDIQQSGWGITSPQVIGCNVSGLVSGAASIPLLPVTINPAGITGDDDTDTLMVIFGNGNGTVEGDLIDSQPTAASYAVNAAESYTKAAAGPPVVLADRVLAAPATRASPCNLTLTNVTNIVRPNVTVATGVAGMTAGKLFNLGAAPKVRVYAIRSGNLVVCDYVAANCAADTSAMTAAQVNAIWTTVAENVVSMRVQYGRDTSAAIMDAMADVWDQTVATTATPVSTDGTRNTQACGLLRVSAVRIALVARSSQPEKLLDGGTHVTENVLAWAGSDANAVAVDSSEAATVAIALPSPNATWPTWQDFRYKIFQTVVPLRNVTSMGVVTGC